MIFDNIVNEAKKLEERFIADSEKKFGGKFSIVNEVALLNNIPIGRAKISSLNGYYMGLKFEPMIWWHEYKQFRLEAKKIIETGDTENDAILRIMEEMVEDIKTEEEGIEDIINVLSGGKHYLPLEKQTKTVQQTMFNNDASQFERI